jgi:tetratricopeptide (TPR) repeat protein
MRGNLYIRLANRAGKNTHEGKDCLKNAVDDFNQMLRYALKTQDKIKAWFNLSKTYIMMGEFGKAAYAFNNYYALSKDDTALYEIACKLYEAKIFTADKPAGALEYFSKFLQKVTQTHPCYTDALIKKAKICLEIAHYERAMDVTRLILNDQTKRFTKGPDDPLWKEALFLRGICAFRLFREKKAPTTKNMFALISTQTFEDFLSRYPTDKTPDSLDVCYYLGQLYIYFHHYNQASSYFEKLIKIGELLGPAKTPSQQTMFENTFFLLSKCYLSLGKYWDTKKMLTYAITRFSENKFVLDGHITRAKANIKLGYPGEAKKDLNVALQLYESKKEWFDSLTPKDKRFWQRELDDLKRILGG